MATVEQHNEQLTIQKNQLLAAIRSERQVLGVLAKNHGTKKKGRIEYRVTKKQLEDLGKIVNLRPLGTGGVVVELLDPPEEG